MEETYDFRQEADVAGEVSAEIDYLDTQQLVKVHNYIQDLQKETDQSQLENAIEWFEKAILPSLKILAQKNSALLEIKSDGTIVVATFRSECGIDIYTDNHRMGLLLNQANHISIEKNDEECVLVLSYDCNDF